MRGTSVGGSGGGDAAVVCIPAWFLHQADAQWGWSLPQIYQVMLNEGDKASLLHLGRIMVK